MAGHFTKESDIVAFRRWLVSGGATVTAVSDSMALGDILSARTRYGAIVIQLVDGEYVYSRKVGLLAKCWRNGLRVSLIEKKSPRSFYHAIVQRDGPNCWFCDCELDDMNRSTMEHLVAESKGGPDCIENFVIACHPCNNNVGTLSVAEKVRYREKRQRRTAAKRKKNGQHSHGHDAGGQDRGSALDRAPEATSRPLDDPHQPAEATCPSDAI